MKSSFLATVSVGLILSLSIISVCLGFSQVIYSGRLVEFLPYGAAFSLAGSAILILITCLFSDTPSAIARPQDEPLPLIIVLIQTAGVYFHNSQSAFLTILAMMVATGLITGLTLYLFGKLKWGILARYFPFPVIAGLLAGSGLLLIISGLHQVMPIHQFSWEQLRGLVNPNSMILWLPSILYGVIMFIISIRFKNPLLFPASIVASIILFYLIVFLSGTSFEYLKSNGFLLQTQQFSLHHLFKQSTLSDPIQWMLLVKNIPLMIAIALISVLSLLFITISIELSFNKTIDFNKELKIAGIANIFSALAGGIVGYHGLGNAVVAEKFHADNRIIGVICAAFCIIALLFPGFLSYFPRFMLVGLVIFLGLALFHSWSFAIFNRFNKLDICLILTVISAVVILGFIQGMIIGILIAALLFAYTYTKVNVIRYIIDGKLISSSQQRDLTAATLLKKHGGKFIYIKLQGFIFFGSANSLANHVKSLVHHNKHFVEYIIYDISRVDGFDSSSFLAFERISDIANKNQLKVILTGLHGHQFNLSNELIKSLFSKDGVKIINDTDEAINYCEQAILEKAGYDITKSETIKIKLDDYLDDPSLDTQINLYFDRVHIPKGEYLVKQDDLCDDLLYVESGIAAVNFEHQDDEKKILLSTIGAGNFIGEIAFYLHSKRTASVIAKTDCQIMKLNQANLKKMRQHHPELAYKLQEAITRLLSHKLINTTHKLDLMSK